MSMTTPSLFAKRAVHLLSVVIILIGVNAAASTEQESLQQQNSPLSDGTLYERIKTGDLVKLGSELGELVWNSETDVGASEGNQAVTIDVAAGPSVDLRALLESMDLEVTSCYRHLCTAQCPVNKLIEVAGNPRIQTVTRPHIRSKYLELPLSMFPQGEYIASSSEMKISKGSIALRADLARSRFSVDGFGVKIGVISTSYDCDGQAQRDVNLGYVPDGVDVVKDLTEEQCADETYISNDEGRAMIALAYGIAPGAEFAFHHGQLGQADFAAAVTGLMDAGCDIIVDGLEYSDETTFEDGVVAQAVNDAVEFGIPFFSAVGNYGRQAWEEPEGFIDSGESYIIDGVNYGNMHLFETSSDTYLEFTKGSGTLEVTLFWDEPSFIASGKMGSRGDMDCFAVIKRSNKEDKVIASSTDSNIGANAFEYFQITDDDIEEGTTLDLVITHRSGRSPDYLKVIFKSQYISDPGEFPEPHTGSAYGHEVTEKIAAVGTAWFRETPMLGRDPAVATEYSSAGSCPILFDEDGFRLEKPIVAESPAFTGVDGTDSIPDFGTEPDQFGDRRFFGTSAAAAHVSGVAALLMQADPSISPMEMYEILQNTTDDMNDDGSRWFDWGYDYKTGDGLVDTYAAFHTIVVGPMGN